MAPEWTLDICIAICGVWRRRAGTNQPIPRGSRSCRRQLMDYSFGSPCRSTRRWLGGGVLAAARRCSRWRRHLVDRHLYKRASIILETQRVAAVGGDDTWWSGTLPQRVAAVGGDDTWWIGTSTSVPVSSWRPLVHGLQCLGANLHRGARGARCGRVLGSGCQFHSGATSRVASKALVA